MPINFGTTTLVTGHRPTVAPYGTTDGSLRGKPFLATWVLTPHAAREMLDPHRNH